MDRHPGFLTPWVADGGNVGERLVPFVLFDVTLPYVDLTVGASDAQTGGCRLSPLLDVRAASRTDN